ncbi:MULTISPECIES: uracil phosphoribosyltransferase [Roseivirga]|jgi:uracil phosphoribosyltransferase|uniref:Uracil phosphoribosyltransferase n=1 Tax=Roseivirga thermotolerans TaxID=1758176 RepID=A0ABQ3I176_9BACT|nr:MULTISPECIES: uracil phosphoribosyltransferase [Roseivirga]MEC7753028.1 uracil phosphoribosyltransferase [Bacteroidota bacterium]GHE52453.1 uracil phosphoribosyltransferase [Roseivirga thermotolerans]|tara:strand:- start:1513 stop:2160 length:648 start_codon:yes stop_codon:yes gene_type:complete
MFILDRQNSIANQYLAEIRHVGSQSDMLRFRHNMKRLGQLLAYEISKTLLYETRPIETPLVKSQAHFLADQVVVISILRAALPFSQGFQDVFDSAEFGFIGAARKPHLANEPVEVALDYLAAPDLNNKVVVVVDPMLATGKSIVKSIDHLLQNGTPKKLHIATIIAAPEGVDYLQRELNTPYDLWSCALDEKLNEKYYIVPGLGDAGDLAFGRKL